MQAVKISNNCIGDAKLQQANIALMVEGDLDSVQKPNTLSPTQARARNGWQWIVSMLRDQKGDESEKGFVALDNVSPSDTREAVSYLLIYLFSCGSMVVDSETLVNLFELISHILDLN